MIMFRARCTDAGYDAEHLFMKTITGNGFLNNKYGDAFIKYDGHWYEVDARTVEIIEEEND